MSCSHRVIAPLLLTLCFIGTAEAGLDFPGFSEAISESGFVQFAPCPVEEMGFWDDKGHTIWCGRTPVSKAQEFKKHWKKFTSRSSSVEYWSKWAKLPNGTFHHHFWFGDVPGFIVFNPVNQQVLFGLNRGVLPCGDSGPQSPIHIGLLTITIPVSKQMDLSMVTKPEKIHYVQPNYPIDERNNRIDGKLLIRTVIDEEGFTTDQCVISAEPDSRSFKAAAVDAIRQWRYSPATYQGEPASVYLFVHVQFSIDAPQRGIPWRVPRRFF